MATELQKQAARLNGKFYGGCKPKSFEERKRIFLSKIKKVGNCWIWTGSKSNGYGNFCFKGKPIKATHFSYYIYKGDTDGLWVLHECDNPACVNPDHLFLGDAKLNYWDARRKGRSFMPPPNPRLVSFQLAEKIKSEFVPFKITAPKLARKYGLKIHLVKHAIYGSYYKRAEFVPSGQEGCTIEITPIA